MHEKCHEAVAEHNKYWPGLGNEHVLSDAFQTAKAGDSKAKRDLDRRLFARYLSALQHDHDGKPKPLFP